MKKSLKKIIFALLFLNLFFTVRSQDIHFSQFTMTPMLINPAQAGAQNDLRAIMNYKNQWSSVAEPYRTYNFSFEVSSNKKKNYTGFSGYGVNLFSDKAGDANMGTFLGTLSYAYHLFLSEKSTLGGGLYAAVGQRSIDFTKLQWGSQYDGMVYDPNLASGEPAASNSFMFLDLGGGVHWEYSKNEKYMTGNDQLKFSAGIALFHVNSPKYSFYDSGEKLLMKKMIYGNALIGVTNTNLSIVPGFFYCRQGKANELLLGSMFRYQFKENSKYTGYVKGSSIATGLYYRNRDALVVNLLYEFSQYAVGVSYDFNISGLKTASNGMGGIEIALRFVSPNPFLYSKSRYY
jgi:type IX secretion system PorP/SprF family membrane protein